MKVDLKRVDDKKEMNKIMMLHQEHYPKDVSRRALQRIYNEACGTGIRDLLGVDKKR